MVPSLSASFRKPMRLVARSACPLPAASMPRRSQCPFVSLLASAPGVLVVSFIGFFFDFDM
jgi:hypothetical protein